MSWALLVLLVLALGSALLALRTRRAELSLMARGVEERSRARERGSDRARLQHPHVDLSRCIGCGLCVAACPEDGVLDVIHGQAQVVHGARCVGHGRCAAECPVGAIALTLADVDTRRDLPALTERFESVGVPGLFLAGEVTGYALIRTAITQGTGVAREVVRRSAGGNGRGKGEGGHGNGNGNGNGGGELFDLCIVGAGPAGIACSLEAKASGLSFVTLDQEELGGTVAKYPRRKLVMTQPVDLPLHGRLARTSYGKEELLELWVRIAAEHALPIRTSCRFTGLERRQDGSFVVQSSQGEFRARHVCLCLGRRGTPRKLGVPGEELSKVAYSLLDARSFQGRRLLVVGGGDSAVEAAIGLAEQPGNEVTVSYRRAAFTRLKARNELALQEAIDSGRLRVMYASEVLAIEPEAVQLRVGDSCAKEHTWVPNDEVFVLAGGEPPFPLLSACGVSFDPADRPAAPRLTERGPGLRRALAIALAVSLAGLAWVLFFRSYYRLPLPERALSDAHGILRPSGRAGLLFGALAALAMLCNLAYLLRRSPKVPFERGSLQSWMSAHVATGLLALLLATLHSAMAPRDTVGGHALAGLCVLVATGALGRYFYAFVPRAANGRELLLEEAKERLASLSAEWDRAHPELGERVRREVAALVEGGHWRASLPRRIRALLASQARLRAALARLDAEGRRIGLAADQLAELESLMRRAHRAALAAAHFEDLRGLLASWRYLHRWVALSVVLLVLLHVITALRYAELFGRGGGG